MHRGTFNRAQNARVLHVRICVPTHLSADVVAYLTDDAAVSSLVVVPGAAVRPSGDLVLADLPREAVNDVVDRLVAMGVHREGSVQIEAVEAWASQAGLEAERRAPGAGADSVVWAEVTHRAYEDSELNWTYLSFMVLATVIAAIAIVLDSQVLVIGAMVLGPEFGAVAALGLGIVRRRGRLLRRAAVSLVLGFVVAIAATCLLGLLAHAAGWVTVEDMTRPRPGTGFVYTPDAWSFVVALVAGAAGVLSLTSSRVGGLAGVFISVTTIPAAGNVALGMAVGVWDEVWGSTLQLGINLVGMAVAGALTLLLQQAVWRRVGRRRTIGAG